MFRKIRKALARDDGFSLIELSVAMILSGIVVGALTTVFFAFSQNAGDASSKAEHQATARDLVSDIVVELRQAFQADPNAEAIVRLTPDLIEFYTMPIGSTQPVKVVYERDNCVEGSCALKVRRYAVESFSSGKYTFRSSPFQQATMLEGVMSDQPLFFGINWQGSPKVRVAVNSCSPSTPCTFPLVGITLRARPLNTSEGARAALEVHEEVRIRNA